MDTPRPDNESNTIADDIHTLHRLGYPQELARCLSGFSNFAFSLSLVFVITTSQAIVNHLGMRVTKVLTDFSGYWILIVSVVLTISLLAATPGWDFARLVTFTNYSGLPSVGDPVWPKTDSIWWLFALGLLLP